MISSFSKAGRLKKEVFFLKIRFVYTGTQYTVYFVYEVTQYNEKVIKRQPNRKEVIAVDCAVSCKNETQNNVILDIVHQMNFLDTQGLPTVLQLSTNVNYVLATNVYVSDSLFNGEVGVLKFIEQGKSGIEVIRVVV